LVFFRRLVLFLWFSIVFQNNYGGDSKSLFQTRVFFLVRRPIAIPVATITILPLVVVVVLPWSLTLICKMTPFLTIPTSDIIPEF